MHSASRLDIEHARLLRNDMPKAEACLWMRLRGEQLEGHRFRRQVPMGAYVLDFACLKSRLVIEVDGDTHTGRQELDRQRTAWLESRGFKVIRFTNLEVLHQTEGVLETIRTVLHTKE
jgi:very-short-patch-repair endonuclease